MSLRNRRAFLRDLGISSLAAQFVMHLPSLGWGSFTSAHKQRVVFMFSPNGTIPKDYWPDQLGADFQLKRIMEPLQAYRDRLLVVKGIANKIRGDGDGHMRGMSCLLTAIELFPGNIQGGSDTPAGWAKGPSIDQEIKNFLQSRPESLTRFGSLEFGVGVRDRADPWTRWVYAGPNQPIAPIDDPYQMFEKLYGQMQDRESVQSILDDVSEELRHVRQRLSQHDRQLLDANETFVREMERSLAAAADTQLRSAIPVLEPNVKNINDKLPELSRMQIDLLVHALQSDMNRVATLQYTKSVGQAGMNWLGVDEGHHTLSHESDENVDAQEKLVKINRWFCEQLAYLVDKLAQTPEPDGNGTLLDHTTVIWTNELGKGNSHTLNDIPFLMVGNGLGFQMGRSLQFDQVPHNRLHMALAHAMGHEVESFGNPMYCEGGPLTGLHG